MGNQIAAVIGAFLIYVALRLAIFELLTPILRRIPAARAAFVRLNARGWLRAETRSRDLYVAAMRRLAALLEWVTGRGLLRGLTFALVACACLFLATLPLERINGGAAKEYRTVRAQALSIGRHGDALCRMDHLVAEVERQTGRRLFTPPHDADLRKAKDPETVTKALSASMSSDITLLMELQYGRALINRVSQLPPEIRNDPALTNRFAEETSGDLMKSSLANITPLVPANRAFTDDAEEYCHGETPSHGSGFTPRRPRADYDDLMGRLSARVVAAMDAKDAQAAFLFFQERMAIIELTYAFFIAFGGGFVVLASWKLAIAIARAQWRRGWIIINLAMTAGMAAVSILIVAALANAVTASARFISPSIAIQAMALAPNQALERAYQRQADVIIGHAVDVVVQTCVDTREIGGSQGLCGTLGVLSAPWDPVARQYDYSVFVRKDLDPAMLPSGMISAFNDNPLGSAVYGVVLTPNDQQAESSEPGFWRGVNNDAVNSVFGAPILMTLVFAATLLLFFELRKTTVKRVRRIVRPIGKPTPGDQVP